MSLDEQEHSPEFNAAYERLEARMAELADRDGDVFLPNVRPPGPVEYVFIGMEPSLGRWASTAEEARETVRAGFRNFVFSIEDFILHFCIRKYLCESGERYHITDLSKGAMLVERAGIARTHRYDRWYGLLLEEMDLVAGPAAGVFAVGKDVARHLTRRAFPRPFTTVIHYSGLAGSARAAGIVGHEADFAEFRESISLESIIATAAEVLAESVPERFTEAALVRLRRAQLSESRRQLAFNYKLAFEASKRDPSQPQR